MRTEKKLQAVDSWCAWRTLQTWLYLNAMILRHIRASLATKTTTGTEHDNIHNSDYVSRINQGEIDQLPEIAESPSNT